MINFQQLQVPIVVSTCWFQCVNGKFWGGLAIDPIGTGLIYIANNDSSVKKVHFDKETQPLTIESSFDGHTQLVNAVDITAEGKFIFTGATNNDSTIRKMRTFDMIEVGSFCGAANPDAIRVIQEDGTLYFYLGVHNSNLIYKVCANDLTLVSIFSEAQWME